MTQALIAFALLAWLLQIAFGWWQLQRFNRAFDGLCRLGDVGVGRSGGRFRPRVVLALAFDADRRVCGSLLLRGLGDLGDGARASEFRLLVWLGAQPQLLLQLLKGDLTLLLLS